MFNVNNTLWHCLRWVCKLKHVAIWFFSSALKAKIDWTRLACITSTSLSIFPLRIFEMECQAFSIRKWNRQRNDGKPQTAIILYFVFSTNGRIPDTISARIHFAIRILRWSVFGYAWVSHLHFNFILRINFTFTNATDSKCDCKCTQFQCSSARACNYLHRSTWKGKIQYLFNHPNFWIENLVCFCYYCYDCLLPILCSKLPEALPHGSDFVQWRRSALMQIIKSRPWTRLWPTTGQCSI